MSISHSNQQSEVASPNKAPFSLPVETTTYLMCPPDHFGILYEINPWMHRSLQPDLALAREQWDMLVSHLTKAGATIEQVEAPVQQPDMVFTADIGIVDGNRFLPSHFHYPERQNDAVVGANWFRSHGYEISELAVDASISFESSDIAEFNNSLLIAYGFRTHIAAHAPLGRALQRNVYSIQQIDPRLYHLDVCFCTLDERRAIVAPDAWTRAGCELVKKLVPEPLVLELDEALTFCANSVVLGKTLIMPNCPPRVGRILEQWGYTICVSPVSEFLKAGGAAHCLTLPLHSKIQRKIFP
jgi:N-dimethylarginine dimethylaminohydrolase